MARAKAKQPKRKRPWRWALLGAAVVILAVGGYIFYELYGTYNGLDKLSDPTNDPKFTDYQVVATEKPPEWEGKERVNILIMGGDNRGLAENDKARSDSMMVVSLDPVKKDIHLFSVLRDTWVDIPGHGDDRINTAFALGGSELAMQTIGNVLGLDIQYYVYTDFEGFKSVIDAIGGIQNFEVEKDMNYVDNADGNRYDIHLKKGVQDLDGTKALQYVRFRHDAMSDFTRTERQRKLLGAVADKMKNGWNLLKMKKIVDSVDGYVKTNIEVSDMIKLGQLGVNSHIAGQAQVPPMDLISGEKVNGASVLAISDEDKVLEFVQDELTKDSTIPASTDTSVQSGNGTVTNTESNSSTAGSGNTANEGSR
ncbi:LCP family protein [Paenibacillus sacheonensis]|uniref:LytR family transcriptional regulator n=1 Tax=Paenibacillus sacheonensis TaxID=742054 RepID=A0A7X5C008_9BACL|nr:LCP family protein [Paenibacillus sacheonensis]MBM7568011.1 LCP family protein required for cell wall assembly [Paenibacillus sacheonensis]NBC73218.1 LytR family transcriptional regulator [Paenibacillus sacheonensis]